MPRFALTLTAAGIVGLSLLTARAQESPPLGPTDSAGTGSAAGEAESPPRTSDRIGGTPTEPRESPANPAADRPGKPGARSDIQVDTQRGAFLRASSFIGRPVRGVKDAQLGTVGDVLIDPRTYEMRYVLLDTGSGVGTNGLPIIPWMLFRTTAGASANQDFLSVPLTIERLGRAPVTTLGAEDLVWNAAWVDRVDEFYVSDLTERRMSRPELEAESAAQSRGVIGAEETTPGANDTPARIRERRQETAGDRRGGGAVRNRTGARGGDAGRTPGSTDNARRNRGPRSTTPGSATDPARNRGPATGTPGATDDAGRSRGPESPGTPGATPGADAQTPGTGTGTGTTGGTSGSGASGSGNSGTGASGASSGGATGGSGGP